ncbi:MAG: PLP-dependent aminotransferase family protein [Rhizobiaceae bacterium]|nr:PLP-dependent aminotransferase family protein [Rhizobiaceae bacterium]
MWKPTLEPGRPIYRAITDAIARDVENGRLAAGDRLPPQRDLAKALAINLSSVSKAYRLAFDLGLTNGETGRGTFVRGGDPARIPWPSGENNINIDYASNFPIPLDLRTDVLRLCSDMARYDTGQRLLEYAPSGASADDVEAAVSWLRSLGVTALPENVLITSGAINGVFACLLGLTKAGETVLCEDLTSPGLISAARMLGLRLVGIPMDRQGMRIDHFKRIATETGAHVAVLNPTLHNPTLTVLSARRREELAAFVKSSNMILVEDEVYAPLLEALPTPLAALAPAHVCYVTSFSKVMLPGLRIGYLAAPPVLAERLRNAIRVSTWMPSPMLASLASRWVRDGTAARLIQTRRNAGRERIQAACRILRAHKVIAVEEALHVWLLLPPPWRADEFAAYLKQHGITVMPSQDLATASAASMQAVRLSVGAEPNRARFEQGLSRIDRILHGRE